MDDDLMVPDLVPRSCLLWLLVSPRESSLA